MINMKLRFKNKFFWIAIIPAFLKLFEAIAGLFGVALDFRAQEQHLLDIVDIAFVILISLGIVSDPTTKGFRDNSEVMTFDEPVGDTTKPLATEGKASE